ncbi:hypothetical protein XU18_3035 [Perkinsela sp. CCAP 1560/4]|nr:hypothetical protein XU18_3035 [Perkinsela sp. CCAP 1560/4]|eukprot:KNH06098.1 hypothetical protein XU18_3035 [Perkinsela sp. CCAP 1560/4]
MGVIGLTSFVESFYDEYCRKLTKIQRSVVEHLYFDMNSLLHIALREESLSLKSVDSSAQYQFISLLTDAVWSRLRVVLECFYPLKSVFLAFDGPVNLAKLRQQQNRRLKQSVSEQCITPGYWLMPLVENELVRRVGKFLTQHSPTKGKRNTKQVVILSGMRSPGEGEAKIARQLYLNAQGSDVNSSHLIVGNDSDLFMTGMGALYAHNISILNLSSMSIYCIGSIVRSCLSKIFPSKNVAHREISCGADEDQSAAHLVSNFDMMTCLRMDFIFLFLLSGNDYISPVNGFNARNVWLFYQRFLRQKDVIQSLQCALEKSHGATSVFLEVRSESNSKNPNGKFHLKFRKKNIEAFLNFAFPSTKTTQHDTPTSSSSRGHLVYPHIQNCVLEYFQAISWCIETTLTGICPDNRFLPTAYVPTIDEIVSFVSSRDTSKTHPISIKRGKRSSPFLPIVHFHLAVRAPALLSQIVLQDERNTEGDISNTSFFGCTYNEDASTKQNVQRDYYNHSCLASQILSKGSRVLRLLKDEFPPSADDDKLIEEMRFATLQRRNAQNYLTLMQFSFDSARRWSTRDIANAGDGKVALPPGSLSPSSAQPVAHSNVAEFRSLIQLLPQFKCKIDSSRFEGIGKLFTSDERSRPIRRESKKRFRSVSLDVEI